MLVNVEWVMIKGMLQAYHDMLIGETGIGDLSENGQPRRLPFPAPEDLNLQIS